ncbi:hypothetical protein D3C72_1146760 [compost metagenome]
MNQRLLFKFDTLAGAKEFVQVALMLAGFFTAAHKQVKVQHQHNAQVYGKAADLGAELHNHAFCINNCRHANNSEGKANIEQVKADLEQGIGCQGNIGLLVKDIQHKDFTVFEQLMGYRNGEAKGNGQIDEISEKRDLCVHCI